MTLLRRITAAIDARALLLGIPAGLAMAVSPMVSGAQAQTTATLQFQGNPWPVVSNRVAPGLLAARAEYVLETTGNEPLEFSFAEARGMVKIPGPIVSSLRSGRATGSLRFSGPLASLTSVKLTAVPAFQKGKPSRIAQNISPAEISAFLDRVLETSFTVQSGGRPLTGLIGSPRLREEPAGSGQYRLTMPVASLARLADPDSCVFLMFLGDDAYRIAVAASWLDPARTSESRVARANLLAGLGRPAPVLIVSPDSLSLGRANQSSIATARISVRNAGILPVDVPARGEGLSLRFSFPEVLRLDPGQEQTLTVQVEARRAGDLRGKIEVGDPGQTVDLTWVDQRRGGVVEDPPEPPGKDNGRVPGLTPGRTPPDENPVVDTSRVQGFSGSPQTQTSVKLTWKSTGESGRYIIKYVKEGQDWSEARTWPLGNKNFGSTGKLVREIVDNLENNKTYVFRIWAVGAPPHEYSETSLLVRLPEP